MTFQGTVPVRRALQLSLNVPAIELLDRVGASRLSSRLKQAGAGLVLPKDEAPGLAMGLGGVGVTLHDLVQVYSGIPRLGNVMPLREFERGNSGVREPLRLLDPVAAWQVGNVLLGNTPTGKRGPEPDRFQDRHELRLSRCVVRRLRRPHDDRRLGRTS